MKRARTFSPRAKEVNGVDSITLENPITAPISKLVVEGKCAQSGTPTPDAPVDIVCNNGAIKARRHSGLPLDYQMVEWLKPSNAINITGFKTKSTQEITTVFYRESLAATYLYWSDTASSGTTNTTAYLTSSGNWRWDGKTYAISVSSGITITSVQNKNGVWLNGTKYGYYTDAEEFISTNDLSLTSYTNTSVRIYSMTIREGETITLDLVPVQRIPDSAYGFYDKVSGNFYTNDEATFTAGDPVDDPVEIYADGTPEVLTVRGKNLYNPADFTSINNAYLNNNGVESTFNGTSYTKMYIPVKPNTRYTLSGSFDGGNDAYGTGIYFFDSDKHFISRVSEVGTVMPYPRTYTTPSNCYFVDFQFRTNSDRSKWQLELGSTATTYEPYVQPQTASVPMLLSVGDYKDEVEIISGIKTRKVGIKIFDGTETFTVSSSGAMITTISDVTVGVQNVPMNTHFLLETSPTSIAVGTQRFGANGTQIYSTNYYMKHPTITTVADFKAWLADQYAAGTPVTVLYPLATPTTEQVATQLIKTKYKFDTIIDANGAISAKYWQPPF